MTVVTGKSANINLVVANLMICRALTVAGKLYGFSITIFYIANVNIL